MPMLSEIDFASFNSYHEILSHGIDLTEAEKQLTDERKRYLRTAAKEKAGQASGAGALSCVARGIYNRMVKQAVCTVAYTHFLSACCKHLLLNTPGCFLPHGLLCCLQPFAQAVKKLWKEKREDSGVENDDNDPLTDVEYEEVSKAMFEHSADLFKNSASWTFV